MLFLKTHSPATEIDSHEVGGSNPTECMGIITAIWPGLNSLSLLKFWLYLRLISRNEIQIFDGLQGTL